MARWSARIFHAIVFAAVLIIVVIADWVSHGQERGELWGKFAMFAVAFLINAVFARSGLLLWRNFQLWWFGEKTWAVLTAKTEGKNEGGYPEWTVRVTSRSFDEFVEAGIYDPGPVGTAVPVRYHRPTGQVRIIRRRREEIFHAVLVEFMKALGILMMVTLAAFTFYDLMATVVGALQ